MNTSNRTQNAADALERRLRTERPHFAVSEGFTERVMDNLPARRPSPDGSFATREPLPLSRIIMGFAASLCIVLLLLQLLPGKPIPSPAAVTTEHQLPQILPRISLAEVDALTAKLDEPLEKELKNVISDTRQAIQFVASNFLPEN